MRIGVIKEGLRSPLPSHLRTTVVARAGGDEIHIAYHTGWNLPTILYSADGNDNWQSTTLKKTPSSGPWHFAKVKGQKVEFVLSDEYQVDFDKGANGENYLIEHPGNYVLFNGAIQPASAPRLLIVTDLDDTLIGDDEATAAFREWWHSQGAAAGGRLVYNTGRALDLFLQLLQEKNHVMPEPDALISSVGTKIYVKNGEGEWEEDKEYSALLGKGWNLEAVRDACYKALADVGKDNFHFRPPSEMNEFKVTCGVKHDVLSKAKKIIQEKLFKEDVFFKIIVSGKGDWRYLDLVPEQAGKRAALEYVRSKLNFDPEWTLACGDSGNDIDMLEGDHHAVVVGNAQPDLVEWVKSKKGGHEKLIMAKAHRAHGILEGVQEVQKKNGR